MPLLRSRSTALTLGFATLVFGGAIVACTGDEAFLPDATPDASTFDSDATTTPPGDDDDDGSTPDPENDAGNDPTKDADTSNDAGTDVDGSDDPDASVETDAGTDAGGGTNACNDLKPSKDVIPAKCSKGKPTFKGGELMAGKYTLVSVTVFDPVTLCAVFPSTNHVGTLTLQNSGKTFAAEYVLGDPKATETFSQTWAPGDGSSSPATVETNCPTNSKEQVSYSSEKTNNGYIFAFYAPYGKNGSALYTWQSN